MNLKTEIGAELLLCPKDIITQKINYMAQRMRDERTPKEMNPNIIRGLGLERAPIGGIGVHKFTKCKTKIEKM